MDELTMQKTGDLSNESLKPRKYSERTVGPVSFGVIWFGLAVQLMIFMLAGQLTQTLSVFQIIIAILVGNTVGGLVMFLTQDIGIKYGLPFAVSLRPAFGYVGTHLPTFIRALPAIFSFGFQTWVAALAIDQISQLAFGWSNIYLFIFGFGILQIASTYFGIGFIAKFSGIASPVMLLIGIYMLVVMLNTYEVSLWEVMLMGGEADGKGMLPLAIMAFIGGWSALLISIQDITRECKATEEGTKSWWGSNRKFILTGWLGLVPACVLFGGLGAVAMALTGEWNPVIVLTQVIGDHSPLTAIILLVFVVLATWSTNAGGNLLPPGYIISNLLPSKITYGRGVIIAGAIGLLIQPWRTADYLGSVFGIIASIIAPVAGILLTDYYLVRKRQLDLNAIYDSTSYYRYWKGINPAAIIAYVLGIVASIPVWDYMFFIGIVISSVSYYFMMNKWILRTYPQHKQSDLEVEQIENINN